MAQQHLVLLALDLDRVDEHFVVKHHSAASEQIARRGPDIRELKRIEESAPARDEGQADTISDTRNANYWGSNNGGFNGGMGGF